jgi:hypothetical protein
MTYAIRLRHCAATLSLGLFSGLYIAAAQTPEAIATPSNVYEPTDFESYQPRTALDMVNRIPGFQIEFADQRRGLGQGGANVLINGERLSGKTDPVEQLERITASRVERIEIVDGTSLDIPGLSGQVANITTSADSGASGTWQWRPQFRNHRSPDWFDGSVTRSGTIGTVQYTASLKNSSFRNGARGPEEITTPADGLIERRQEDGYFYGDEPTASLDLSAKPAEGHTANLNLQAFQFNFIGFETSDRTAFGPGGQTASTRFSESTDRWGAEIGGDYEFPVGPGKLKLIGLYEYRETPQTFTFDIFERGAISSGSLSSQDSERVEAILRSEYSWAPKDGRDWQVSIEGAFNSLELASGLFVRDVSGELVERVLDDPLARVEERRAETTVTHSRALSSKWDLQASAGVEYSELSQSGASSVKRDFVRPKGFVSATYKPSDTFNIRAKFERDVGQLNFFDFISSVNITDNLNQTGNPDLVPDQSWMAELEFDKTFSGGHTFKARFYGEQITDIVGRIPIGNDGDAVGNIDSADRYGVDFSSTLKGDPLGVKGAQLDLVFEIRGSSVDDPLTGRPRRLNADKKSYWSAEFRHDIPNSDWAYGFSADRFEEAEFFRLNTQQQFTFTRPFTSVFVEHKDVYGLTVTGTVFNLLDSGERFQRDFFTARRDIGTIARREDNRRTFDPILGLEISGTF